MNRLAGSFAVWAALLPVAAAPASGAASVPPIPKPASVLAVSPFNVSLSNQLQGTACQTPNTCTPVLYMPFQTWWGASALEDALTRTDADHIVVLGYSNGAQVAAEWLTRHSDDPNAPSPNELSFVVIGNPTRSFGGSDAQNGVVWPKSDYQVIDIAQQYDSAADFPNNPASPYYILAVVNALVGFYNVPHLNYSNVNINDPANAVWTVDTITYVLTPTNDLPILLGLAPLFPALNTQLKADIETAYIRPVPFPTPPSQSASGSTSAASALADSMLSDPAVAAEDSAAPLRSASVDEEAIDVGPLAPVDTTALAGPDSAATAASMDVEAIDAGPVAPEEARATISPDAAATAGPMDVESPDEESNVTGPVAPEEATAPAPEEATAPVSPDSAGTAAEPGLDKAVAATDPTDGANDTPTASSTSDNGPTAG